MTPGLLGDLSVPDLLTFVREQIPVVSAGNPTYRDHYYRAVDDFESGANPYELPLFLHLKRYPVDVEEFMFSPAYLNRPRSKTFPAVLEELCKINNPNGYRLTNPYTEAVFTGGIGSAKTTTALYTTGYQLYLLSCFRDPHGTFNMDSTSEVMFIFQSISGGLAESVDYHRFREICLQSTYFRTVYPFDLNIKKYLKFPARVEVRPISTDTGSIGQNVVGGIIDELNFMAMVEGSKRSIDRGTYNQALTIYNGVARRRKSRFMDAGRMPGILCLVSSKRYPGEFTDKKIEEAKRDATIYIYDKRVWEVKPEGTFNRGFFDVFIGDLTRKAHILEPQEPVTEEDAPLIVSVPTDFRTDFEDDIIGSLRDIAGVGTLARYPFIMNVGKVTSCFGKAENVFSVLETDFVSNQVSLKVGGLQNKHLPRWAHIDLGVTNDSCGLAIGHVPRFVVLEREQVVEGGSGKHKEVLPVIRFDGLLRIRPPKGDEILFFKVRRILYLLREAGLNIVWVSFDSFQSVDSIQLLKQQGFTAGRQSMDVSADPYILTKSAFYDGRLELPEHPWCQKEFLSLEKDAKTGKIDHPPEGSKDVSDAVAGVVTGLSQRRELWAMFGVQPQAIRATQDIEVSSHGSEDPQGTYEPDFPRVSRSTNTPEEGEQGEDDDPYDDPW